MDPSQDCFRKQHTTNNVSEGLMFLRRSSSFRLILPSPLAHSARKLVETFSTSLQRARSRVSRESDT